MKRITKSLLIALTATVFLVACSEDETPFNSEDEVTVASDAEVQYAFEDVDDMTTSGLAIADEGAGLRTSNDDEGENDDRWRCANFSHEKTGSRSGIITIDFGNGCTDPRGRVRKGKVIITYNGRRWEPGSTRETTFEGYSIVPNPNSELEIELRGVRLVENISESGLSAPTFRVTLSRGEAIFSDGTSHQRTAERVKTWNRGASPLGDSWEVTGTASGTNRRGQNYSVIIQETLVFSRACFRERVFIPVSGVKVITTDEKEITVDYGDGSCDNMATITVGGNSSEVNLARVNK